MVGDDIESDIGGALAAGARRRARAHRQVPRGPRHRERHRADRDRRLDRRRARAARGSRRLTGGPRIACPADPPTSRARIPRHDGQSGRSDGRRGRERRGRDAGAARGRAGTPGWADTQTIPAPRRRRGAPRRHAVGDGAGGVRAQPAGEQRRPAPPQHRHLVQENRSFDHYYGYAPQVQAAGFGPPPGYTQPDAAGGRTRRSELTRARSPDPPHHWDAVHRQYNDGKMDGFYTHRAARQRRRQPGDGLLHGARAAVLLQPVRGLAGCARTTSARCSGRRCRTAST